MNYFTTTSNAARRAVDCVIVGVFERGKLASGAADLDAASKGGLKALLKSGDISAKAGQCRVLNGLAGVRAPRVVVCGLGKPGSFGVAEFRRAVIAATAAIKDTRAKSVLNTLTLEDVNGADAYYLARHTVESIGETLYRFEEMKSGRKKPAMPLKSVGVSIAKRGDAARASRGCEHGNGIAGGVALARDLGNLPANVCTPSYLARTAKKLAAGNGKLTTRVMTEAEMKKLGMHSLLSVTAGTDEPAKMIIMQYKGGGTGKPIVLVGKGVTFDSGGISLKPGLGMDEMKFDMCGAAGVIGTMKTVAMLKLPVNLTVIVPAVENLPSGNATKPGDIVKSMSGQTIEILNTDAEGRLILCDALTYARRLKPQTVIDVATLTGACVIALGAHHTGIMSNDDELAREIQAAGVAAADRGWHLPIGGNYAQQLKSNFADMANVGGREAGALTAGTFLGKFTDGLNWAHLDIAGTAWKTGARKGATGRPVPMLSQLVLERCGALP